MLIEPTGDKTGQHDTQRMRAMLEAIANPHSSIYQSALAMEGQYYFNETIDLGNPLDYHFAPQCLHGIGSALVDYVGPRMSGYLFRVFGYGWGGFPRLSNLIIRGNGKCRGVLLASQQYQSVFGNLSIIDTIESGMDAPNCWNTHLHDIRFVSCDGFSLRMNEANNVLLQHLTFTSAKSGDTNWPAADDKACIVKAAPEAERAYFAVGVPERCAAYIQGTGVTLQSYNFEACSTGTNPLLLFLGRHGKFTSGYLEANTVDTPIVLLGSKNTRPNFDYGAFNDVDGIYCNNQIAHESIVKMQAFSNKCSVRNVECRSVSGSVVSHDGGTHNELTIQDCVAIETKSVG